MSDVYKRVHKPCISGTEQTIDKREMALSTTIFATFDESILVNYEG